MPSSGDFGLAAEAGDEAAVRVIERHEHLVRNAHGTFDTGLIGFGGELAAGFVREVTRAHLEIGFRDFADGSLPALIR